MKRGDDNDSLRDATGRPKYTAVYHEFQDHCGLPMAERSVYFAVLSYATGVGTKCWPGYEPIAHRAGCSVPTVRRSLKKLEAAGFLTIETRRRKDGGQTSNQYTVLDPTVGKSAPDHSDHPPDRGDQAPPDHSDHPPLITVINEEEPILKKNQFEEEPLKKTPTPVRSSKSTSNQLVPSKSEQIDVIDDAEEVFRYWQQLLAPRARFDQKRRKLIKARLAEGYTIQELREAIQGNAWSRFHRGENETNTKYHSLELILRNAGKVDEFRTHFDAGPTRTNAESTSDWLGVIQTIRS